MDYSGNTTYGTKGGPNHVFVETQTDTIDALQKYAALTDSAYAKMVILGYAKAKLKGGKSLEQVDKKLHSLGKAIIANGLGPWVDEIQQVRTCLWANAASTRASPTDFLSQPTAGEKAGLILAQVGF